MSSKLSFSICIPVYNCSRVLKETLDSIDRQRFKNYEIIIGDDNPPERREEIQKTKNIIDKYPHIKFIYIKHKQNLGCQKNLNIITSHAKGDIIYMVAQDDVISIDSLQSTHDAFLRDEDIGAVTRGYFWFDDNMQKPVRLKLPVDQKKDTVVSIFDNPKKIISVFNTVDNITGLAFRKKYLTVPFHKDIFTTHVYPFASIFKYHKVICLKNYIFACRIKTSQSRQSFAYMKSPLQSWVDLFETVFPEKKYKKMRESCVRDFVATNYIGLIQIRNYACYRNLIKEILLLLKYRWSNIFKPVFWLISLTCLCMPKSILIPLTDWYKKNINSKVIRTIKFNY